MTELSDERRAIMRIHAAWLRLASNGFPSLSAIDSREFGADWSNCLFLKIDGTEPEPRVSYSESELEQKCISRALADTFLALAQRHISRVLATGQPVGYGGTGTHESKEILYRIVLLPLSEDRTNINALLCGMTYRDIPPARELRVSDIAWCKSPLT